MQKRVIFITGVLALGWQVCSAQVLTPGSGPANDQGQSRTNNDVAFVPRDSEASYGYKTGYTGFGLSLFNLTFPNPSWDVYGFRLNLGWGGYNRTCGFDTGTFSASRSVAGLQVNLFGNFSAGEADGLQIGLANVNRARTRGLQIGVVNVAGTLEGVQIGLLNFAKNTYRLPLLNVGW